MDPPISNYRPADHLSKQYLLLLKMLIAFQIRLLFMLVLCNTNEEIGFCIRLYNKSKMEEMFRSVAGMSCPVFAPYLYVCVRAQRSPLGSLSFSICVCQAIFFFFFEANTHFITLTLIKNTWPYSRGQSVHKSAQCSVQHSPSKAHRPLLLRS